MLEIKVNIEATAPDLSAAIEKLAVALKGSVVLSPEGVQTQLSGVQVAGNPTVTPASATVESVPAVNTNAQQAVAQNAVDQIPAAQAAQAHMTRQTPERRACCTRLHPFESSRHFPSAGGEDR